MSDGVRNRPPPSPGMARARPAKPLEMEASVAANEASASKEAPASRDVFEGGGALQRTQVKQQIQAVANRSLSELQFSNEDLAYLASTLVALAKKDPKASRAKRAKTFTRAILRGRGKMARMLDRLDEKEAEQMFDDIANILSESPRLAEWIDSITEEAQKLSG